MGQAIEIVRNWLPLSELLEVECIDETALGRLGVIADNLINVGVALAETRKT